MYSVTSFSAPMCPKKVRTKGFGVSDFEFALKEFHSCTKKGFRKKVGHLYCRICIGIEASNLRRILCNKFISKVSESWIESELRHKFGTNATVDDQPVTGLSTCTHYHE